MGVGRGVAFPCGAGTVGEAGLGVGRGEAEGVCSGAWPSRSDLTDGVGGGARQKAEGVSEAGRGLPGGRSRWWSAPKEGRGACPRRGLQARLLSRSPALCSAAPYPEKGGSRRAEEVYGLQAATTGNYDCGGPKVPRTGTQRVSDRAGTEEGRRPERELSEVEIRAPGAADKPGCEFSIRNF